MFIVVKFGGGADKFGVDGGGTDILGRLMAGERFVNWVLLVDIVKIFIFSWLQWH